MTHRGTQIWWEFWKGFSFGTGDWAQRCFYHWPNIPSPFKFFLLRQILPKFAKADWPQTWVPPASVSWVARPRPFCFEKGRVSLSCWDCDLPASGTMTNCCNYKCAPLAFSVLNRHIAFNCSSNLVAMKGRLKKSETLILLSHWTKASGPFLYFLVLWEK